MTVHKALLIDIEPHLYGSFLCTFCIKRDKFHLPIPSKMAATLSTGQYYDVDFDVMTNVLAGVGNNFSFNFINPTKDNSHD
jgi:hypothetical protein